MKLTDHEKIILRDFKESDIEKRIYWDTVETEWQLWDAPWEYDGLTEEKKKTELETYIVRMREWASEYAAMPEDKKRTKFQICTLGPEEEYIGWCGSYRIDDDYNISESGEKCAVGIDIPERSARGKGYAAAALRLFIDYLLAHGEKEIYTQTWSGNFRMIGLAKKLGFEEVKRKPDLRTVRGEKYDGLTFRLNPQTYRSPEREKK